LKINRIIYGNIGFCSKKEKTKLFSIGPEDSFTSNVKRNGVKLIISMRMVVKEEEYGKLV